MGSFSLAHRLLVLAILPAGRRPHATSDLARGMRARRAGMRDDKPEGDGARLIEAHPADRRRAAAQVLGRCRTR